MDVRIMPSCRFTYDANCWGQVFARNCAKLLHDRLQIIGVESDHWIDNYSGSEEFYPITPAPAEQGRYVPWMAANWLGRGYMGIRVRTMLGPRLPGAGRDLGENAPSGAWEVM